MEVSCNEGGGGGYRVSRSFISLIAHGYDAAAVSVQDDFIAVLGIEGVIFHARNFLMKHGIFSDGQYYSRIEVVYFQPRRI